MFNITVLGFPSTVYRIEIHRESVSPSPHFPKPVCKDRQPDLSPAVIATQVSQLSTTFPAPARSPARSPFCSPACSPAHLLASASVPAPLEHLYGHFYGLLRFSIYSLQCPYGAGWMSKSMLSEHLIGHVYIWPIMILRKLDQEASHLEHLSHECPFSDIFILFVH